MDEKINAIFVVKRECKLNVDPGKTNIIFENSSNKHLIIGKVRARDVANKD